MNKSIKIHLTKEFLFSLEVGSTLHTKGQSLYSHLVRVQEILKSWECDENVQILGLLHSIYSTQYFKKQVVEISKRKEIEKIVGEDVENLVYLFSQINRDTFAYSERDNNFYFKNHETNELIVCKYTDGLSMLHVLFANDLDHIDLVGIGAELSYFKRYEKFYQFLNKQAQEELSKIIQINNKIFTEASNDVTKIRFIAHSGVQIFDDKVSLVIDPWLFDSRRENPIIEGLDPTQRTIDYLIPEPKNSIYELRPDIVCLSHFHTHHAPLREIVEFVKLKEVTIICPKLSDEKLSLLQKKVGDFIFNRITFIFLEDDKEILSKNFKIKAMLHNAKGAIPHFMFYVTLNNKSLLHIVDASLNVDDKGFNLFSTKLSLLHNLKPTFLFIGAAGHLGKLITFGKRTIIENSSLTPAQAAQVASLIKPNYVSIIGMYNHSVWDSRSELGLSVGEAESQLGWCLTFLSPSVVFKKINPGDVF